MTGKRKESVMAFKSKLISLMGDKQRRDAKRITPADVAEATGLSRQTIYAWMSEKAEFETLSADTVDALCQYFGCGIDDLVELVKKTKKAA